MVWPLRVLDRLAGEAVIVVDDHLRSRRLHYRRCPLIIRGVWPVALPVRPRLWLYWESNYSMGRRLHYSRVWYASPLTPLGLLAAVCVALPLCLLHVLGWVGRDLRALVGRMRTVGGPVVPDGAPQFFLDVDGGVHALTEGVPIPSGLESPPALPRYDAHAENRADFDWLTRSPYSVLLDEYPPRDYDPETIARLVEYAHAENRADFDWLARSVGVPAGDLEAMWQGTRQRVRRLDRLEETLAVPRVAE